MTRLFDEFRRALEDGRDPDVEGLIERAGAGGADLRGRMRVYEKLNGISAELARKDPPAPRRVGRFEIRSSIARGGLGRVYLAYDSDLDRLVALKVLDRSLGLDRDERTWVLNEARSLARLAHPGVVRVFEVGDADGFDYVAMEHLTGPTLEEVIAELHALARGSAAPGETPASAVAATLGTIRARIRCLQTLASALAYCHNRGILHRDIKPANVLFDRDGAPKLIDFGLAHMEDAEQASNLRITQQLIGSAAYVAPEQVELSRTGADPRSDQFSLSTVCYELLALEHPFPGSTTSETMQAVARSDPRPLRRAAPLVSTDLERLVHHGLEHDPDDRYPTVQAMADDLVAVLGHRPISVAEPSLIRRTRLWARRHRARVAVGAAVLSLVVVLAAAQWVTGTIQASGRVRAELDGLAASSQDDPAQLQATAVALLRLQVDARTHDASLVRRWFGGALGPEVGRAVDAWSHRLGDAHAASADPEEGAWRLLFVLEEELCPDCETNLEQRNRGRVQYPWEDMRDREVLLLRMVDLEDRRAELEDPFPPLTAFVPVEPVPQPAPGAYRLLLWDPDASELHAEIDFVVARMWDEPKVLMVRRPDPDVLFRSIEIGRSEVPLPRGMGEQLVVDEHLLVPAFRLADEPVTTGEFRRFLEQSGHQAWDFDDERADDEPAWVDLDSAMAYAASVGGRLPGFAELLLAFGRDLLPPTPYPGVGEWVGDPGWETDTPLVGCAFPYAAAYDENLSFLMSAGRRKRPQFGIPLRGVAFRIAFSADDPAFYTQVAQAPTRRGR